MRFDTLARRLMHENEEAILMKLVPLLAKLASEDEMPGKIFALLEEILMALYLFSDGFTSDAHKVRAFTQLLKDKFISVVIQERDLGTILKTMGLLRFIALL